MTIDDVPLTPIQRWFFEQELACPHHWNQSLLLEIRQAVDTRLLEQALGQVVDHHEALRLRFRREGSDWHQMVTNAATGSYFLQFNLATLPGGEHSYAIERIATELQASLDLEDGPLLRVAYFDVGAERAGRLLLIIHHLAVDLFSWEILLTDLQVVYQQLRQGQAPRLPPKTTSFKEWSTRLSAYAQSPQVQQELAYWLAEPRGRASRLPIDFLKGSNFEVTTRTVSVWLSSEETKALSQKAPTQFHLVLLAAVARTFADWLGGGALLVDLEHHGREEIFEETDLSQTVGWFTALVPLLLDLEDVQDLRKVVQRLQEQLDHLSGGGMGYSLLRYLSRDRRIIEQCAGLPQAEVSFNYFGHSTRAGSEEAIFAVIDEPTGPEHSLQGTRPYLLEITGVITEKGLRMDWLYSTALHQQATIERLARSHLAAVHSFIYDTKPFAAFGGYPSARFPEAQLSEQELDHLLGILNESEEE